MELKLQLSSVLTILMLGSGLTTLGIVEIMEAWIGLMSCMILPP